MSCESGKGSSPQSESSSGSTNQPLVMFQKERDDVTLHGTPAPLRLSRTQTVRRASKSTPPALDESAEVSKPIQTPHADTPVPEKHRRSLDSTYRHSLESISEYKTKSSFSSMSLFTTSRDASSLDSASSDCTDCMRSFTDLTKEKTFMSASSSYLSWMESVNSEYCASAKSATDVVDVDTKVGEWNNFWLNYSSGSNKFTTSPYLSISNDDKTGEELSDCRSTTSTQREFTDKQISNEQIFLSYDEVVEAVKCSQRVTEILQNALKRNENDVDESRNDSYFSQHSFNLALPALFTVSFSIVPTLLDPHPII